MNDNPHPLINAAAVKRKALQLSSDTRAGKFTRVSRQFLIDANASLDAWLRKRVHSTPSVGKTL